MKSTSIIHTIAAIGFATLTLTASANDFDCFPLCGAGDATKAAAATETPAKTACAAPSSTQAAVEKIENVNNQLKPIKEIAGYIQSPQSLGLKLVNDHIVKIPAWVGYAIDPVGAIKNKVTGEVRDRAKAVLKAEFAKPVAACEATAVESNENAI